MPTLHRIHRRQSRLVPSIPIHITQQRLQNKAFPDCAIPSLVHDMMEAMSRDTIDAHQWRERLKTRHEKDCRVLHEDFLLHEQ